MEKILKKFPEVEQVVSRIGAAEVPTDPMSMEESDRMAELSLNAFERGNKSNRKRRKKKKTTGMGGGMGMP